jgi:hypothetical protein
MHGAETQPQTGADSSNLRFKEQLEDDPQARSDATLSSQGSLEISADENVGGDPYNRTGRFKKIVR